MPPKPKKRSHAVIDLTGDDEGTQAKRPALAATQPSRLNAAAPYSRGGYNNPTPSSQSSSTPNASQPSPRSGHISQIPATQELEYLDLTQDDDGPARELYGTFDAKVVGIRYYNGYASPGELVICQREPNNSYDRNAIRVDSVLQQQIGHLPRKIVEKLATHIDSGDIVVEGQLTGEKGMYECPIRLSFYGPSNPLQRIRIEGLLKAEKFVKAAQLKQTKKDAEARRKVMGLTNGGSTAGGLNTRPAIDDDPELSLDNLLKKSDSVDFRSGADAIKSLALGDDELSKLPFADQPSQLKSQLLPYQLQGLAWMTSKEFPKLPATEDDGAVQLWTRDPRGRYWNVASDFITSAPPKLLSGGILADDMGLGKTLQIISLILTGGTGSTLIIAPVSVMSNWQQQMSMHVKSEHMPKVLIYHGDRKMTAKELKSYHVIITSYGRLAREQDPDVPKALLAMEWRRVVLDEGHTIRNVKTKVAVAATALKAKSRWVLTGTPIINSVKDLQSLVKFLHITGGVEQPDIFNAQITRKLDSGDRSAEVLLQSLMQDICLRRKKDMSFVDLKLPEKKEYIHRITFHPEEKHKYDTLLAEARGALKEHQAESNKGQKGRFQSVLERLLRLRQTCNHWTLCKQRIDDLMELLKDQDVVTLTAKNQKLLQEALRLFLDSQEECAVCYDIPTEPVITNCKHVYCRDCITRAITIQHKCPMCRNKLSEDCLLEPAPEGCYDHDFDTETQSSKTEAMVQIVKATLKNPESKIIIFSQWTSFLDIVQSQISQVGVKYTRIDGSMKADKRDLAIQSLDNDPETRVMLASLAVCSVGLNLVSANTVILSDSWWAPAIEDQAIDRVHRLGQKRETTVWRMVMEGSVEERVLDIQKEKRELVNKAFQEKGTKEKKSRETRMADINKLLA